MLFDFKKMLSYEFLKKHRLSYTSVVVFLFYEVLECCIYVDTPHYELWTSNQDNSCGGDSQKREQHTHYN
ncbi:hypothetical protein APHCRT_0691 [Anaplasma phagocytophilum str. CRT53-1]|uniref:Uncharacterized protein n=1 Tax=Anaplasma phagocytophilum str. CRT53-1 TaxID=1359157 RepID=A0A0F3Q0T5_ANAPH|nr:hypothetical protein APHCRT_0691 [Anaplasma phagocytophilum str. CRT53-1]